MLLLVVVVLLLPSNDNRPPGERADRRAEDVAGQAARGGDGAEEVLQVDEQLPVASQDQRPIT